MRPLLSLLSIVASFVLTSSAHGQCGPASRAIRNGTGVNPMTLTSTFLPAIGTQWHMSLDCTGHGGSQSLHMVVIQGRALPHPGVMTPLGELLIDWRSPRQFRLIGFHMNGPFFTHVDIPNDSTLCGITISFQGLCTGAPGGQLSNAIDISVGF